MLLFSLITFSACDNARVYEKYFPVSEQEWKLNDKKTFAVEVNDTTQAYNLYINIRHTEAYPYSNLWVKLSMKDPAGKEQSQRIGFTLAEPGGRWLGTGLGDIYDDRFPVMQKVQLPKAGTYQFIVQHDMRMDNVPGIMDVGIRLEKAK